MKSLITGLLVATLSFVLLFVQPAAADNAEGAQVFGNNCASCHMGGRNVVNAAKTLKQADLEKYDMASIEAIVNQVTNGKGAMPAFRGRLTDDQIKAVASYVLEQAEQGW